MSLIDVRGSILDPRDGNMQWKMPDSQMNKVTLLNYYYESPPFNFLMRSWRLRLYPNGDENNEGFLTVHLVVQNPIHPQDPLTLNICLNFSLDNMSLDEKISRRMKIATHTFSIDDRSYVWKKISNSKLVWGETSSTAITISCFATKDFLPIFTFYRSMCGKTQVSEDLKKLYEEKRYTDVTFVVQGRAFEAHKLILESRSPKFKTMFEDYMNEDQFVFENYDPDAFEMLLQFLYTGTVEELPLKKIMRLYIVAREYSHDLARMCARYMAHRISEDTFKGIRSLAQKYADKRLLSVIDRFQRN